MAVLVAYVDTNFIIQGKEPRQMPWGEIGEYDEIEIRVTRPVQKELDRHKESSGRRRERAQLANSWLRKAVTDPSGRYEIPSGKPCIFITNDLTPPPNPSLPEDDQIVDLYEQSSVSLETDSVIITGDTGPYITAEFRKLNCHLLSETWRLPPETDDRDKQIAKLKATLEGRPRPKLALSISDVEAVADEYIEINIPVVDQVSETDVDHLMGIIAEPYPRREAPVSDSQVSGDGLRATIERMLQPTPAQWAKYHKEYDAWLGDQLLRLSSFDILYNEKIGVRQFELSIVNIGNIPAKDIRIEVSLSEGFEFAPSNRYEWPDPIFDKPPAAPSARLAAHSNLFGGDAGSNRYRPHRPVWIDPMRDPEELYLDEERGKAGRVYKCGLVRHHLAPLTATFPLIMDVRRRPKGGILKVVAHAENIELPITLQLPIRVHIVDHGMEPLLARIRDELGIQKLNTGMAGPFP